MIRTHDSIRKYTIIMGSLLNNISFDRKDNNGEVAQQIVVPVSYGPSEKYLQRINADPDDTINDRKVSLQLPRISYQFNGMDYDAERKINPNNIMSIPSKDGGIIRTYTPTPFNLYYSVSINVSALTDGLAIVEELLPKFAPFTTVTFRPLDDSDFTLDANVIYGGMDIDDTYEGDMDRRRTILYNLSFTVQAYIFGPISTNSKPILEAIVNMHDDTFGTDTIESDPDSIIVVTKNSVDILDM